MSETPEAPAPTGLSMAQIFDIVQGNVTVLIQNNTDAESSAEDNPPIPAEE